MKDCLQYPLKISVHLIIPETQNLPALSGQYSVPYNICRIVRVLTPIQLNIHSLANTGKIQNIAAAGKLSLEWETIQTSGAQS